MLFILKRPLTKKTKLIKMGKIKELFEKIDVTKKGYKVNKYLTNGFFILLIIYMAFIVHIDGISILRGDSVYMECRSLNFFPCENPYYNQFSCESSICENKYLFAGETVAVKPSVYARTFGWVAVFTILFALLINHLIYNRGFKFKNER